MILEQRRSLMPWQALPRLNGRHTALMKSVQSLIAGYPDSAILRGENTIHLLRD